MSEELREEFVVCHAAGYPDHPIGHKAALDHRRVPRPAICRLVGAGGEKVFPLSGDALVLVGYRAAAAVAIECDVGLFEERRAEWEADGRTTALRTLVVAKAEVASYLESRPLDVGAGRQVAS